MSTSTMIKTTHLKVRDSKGSLTVLTVSTPVVTETDMSGETFTHEKLGTIRNARGVHVNRKSKTEFESIEGETYTLVG